MTQPYSSCLGLYLPGDPPVGNSGEKRSSKLRAGILHKNMTHLKLNIAHNIIYICEMLLLECNYQTSIKLEKVITDKCPFVDHYKKKKGPPLSLHSLKKLWFTSSEGRADYKLFIEFWLPNMFNILYLYNYQCNKHKKNWGWEELEFFSTKLKLQMVRGDYNTIKAVASCWILLRPEQLLW